MVEFYRRLWIDGTAQGPARCGRPRPRCGDAVDDDGSPRYGARHWAGLGAQR